MSEQGKPRMGGSAVAVLAAVTPSTPEQFGQVVRREYEANAKVVAKAGIRSE